MRIAYTNLIDSLDTSSCTALTTLTGFPITNVQDERLTRKWKSSTATIQTATFHLASTSTVNTVAIIGHNITSTCTVNISANASDSWGSPSFTTALTFIDTDLMLLKFITDQTYEYWQFSFSGQASLEIGRLWLSSYSTIDPSSNIDFSVKVKRSDVVNFGRNRQKFASPGVSWRQFTLSFPPVSHSAVSVIKNIYDTVGNYSAIIFCNFDTSRTYELVDPCYCIINDEMDFGHSRSMKFSYNLTLEEIL
jgi:hypothetical protein